ncbi:hypothetical protein BHE74_00059193 [Ensete ventricosum]|nr:hypothetical protein BHE74_00059193 [Ensete ventricosum]
MGSHTDMVSRKNVMVINFRDVASRVEFRSVFRAPFRKFKILANPTLLAHEFRFVFHALSRKFKILAIHDVLANGKSYEHGFMKKHDSHKHYAKLRPESSFDWF